MTAFYTAPVQSFFPTVSGLYHGGNEGMRVEDTHRPFSTTLDFDDMPVLRGNKYNQKLCGWTPLSMDPSTRYEKTAPAV